MLELVEVTAVLQRKDDLTRAGQFYRYSIGLLGTNSGQEGAIQRGKYNYFFHA